MNIQRKIDQFHINHRKKRFEKTKGRHRGIAVHNAMHNILIPLIRVLRIVRRQKLVVIGDRRTGKKESVIYACTHIGGYDVETLFEAIEDPCYLFMGDPREVYYNFDGLMLCMNGVIFMDMFDKSDRFIAKQTAISLLKQGGSLMIFPEGVWNITENKPVVYIYYGTVQMAIASGADIVPVAIERYENDFYVNIGRNIECGGKVDEDKAGLTQCLRDAMATLKWEIWEHYGEFKRCDISADYGEMFLDGIMNARKTSYTLKDVYDTMFVPKDER